MHPYRIQIRVSGTALTYSYSYVTRHSYFLELYIECLWLVGGMLFGVSSLLDQLVWMCAKTYEYTVEIESSNACLLACYSRRG